MSWECRFGFRPRDLRHSPTVCGPGSRFQSHQTRSSQPLGSAGAGCLAFRLDLALLLSREILFLRAAFAQSSRLATIVLLSKVFVPCNISGRWTVRASPKETAPALALLRLLVSKLSTGGGGDRGRA